MLRDREHTLLLRGHCVLRETFVFSKHRMDPGAGISERGGGVRVMGHGGFMGVGGSSSGTLASLPEADAWASYFKGWP